jgi:hypothetical protein
MPQEQNSLMNRAIISFWLCAGLIWGAAYSSISAGFPNLYSPYATAVIAPAFFLMLNSIPSTGAVILATLVCPIIFVAWSFPLLRQESLIPKRSKVMALFLVVLSLAYFFASWHYGITYQGQPHTIIIFIFNVFFWFALLALTRTNRLRPSFRSAMAFHTVLFVWLAWVAFPYLGELP